MADCLLSEMAIAFTIAAHDCQEGFPCRIVD